MCGVAAAGEDMLCPVQLRVAPRDGQSRREHAPLAVGHLGSCGRIGCREGEHSRDECGGVVVDPLVVHVGRARGVLIVGRPRFDGTAARILGQIGRIPVYRRHATGRADDVLGFQIAVGALRGQQPYGRRRHPSSPRRACAPRSTRQGLCLSSSRVPICRRRTTPLADSSRRKWRPAASWGACSTSWRRCARRRQDAL